MHVTRRVRAGLTALGALLVTLVVIAPEASAHGRPLVATETPNSITVDSVTPAGEFTVVKGQAQETLAGRLAGAEQGRFVIAQRADGSGFFTLASTCSCSCSGRSGPVELRYAGRIDAGGQTATGSWAVVTAGDGLDGLRGGGRFTAQLTARADLYGVLTIEHEHER